MTPLPFWPALVWEGPRPVTVIFLDPVPFRAPRMPRVERSRTEAYRAAPAIEHRMPWPVRLCLALGAVVWLFAIIGARSLFAQVAPVVTITAGQGVTQIGNPSRESQAITVTLWRSLTDSGAPAVLVSPRSTILSPGSVQLVRLRAREACSPLWRYVVLYSPITTRYVTTPVAIHLLTRIVAKISCQ